MTRRDVRQAGLGTGVSLALDFIRIHCAVHNRKADDRVLPLETDQGIGVMVNVPFGRTRVFQNVRGKPVPDWTKELETAVKVAA